MISLMMFDAWVISQETGGYELTWFLHDKGRRGTNNNDDSSIHHRNHFHLLR